MTHRVVLFAVKIPIDAPTPEGAYELSSVPLASQEIDAQAGGSAKAPKKRRTVAPVESKPVTEESVGLEFYVYKNENVPCEAVLSYTENGKTFKLGEDKRFRVTTEDGETKILGRLCDTNARWLCAQKDWAFYVTPQQAGSLHFCRSTQDAHKTFVIDETGKFASETHNEPLLPFEAYQLFYVFEPGCAKRPMVTYQRHTGETVYSMHGYMHVKSVDFTSVVGHMIAWSDGTIVSTDDKFRFEMTETQKAQVQKWRASLHTTSAEDVNVVA